MNDSRKDLSMRCPITAQLVGDQLPGWSFLMLQHLAKEAPSGSTISTFGNQNIDYVSILIHSSPQIEVLTSDFDEELIYMPDVAESPLLPPQIASIGRPELQTPISNCLVRNDDASLSKEVFDVAKAHREPMVQPDGVTDDYSWKAMPSIL